MNQYELITCNVNTSLSGFLIKGVLHDLVQIQKGHPFGFHIFLKSYSKKLNTPPTKYALNLVYCEFSSFSSGVSLIK